MTEPESVVDQVHAVVATIPPGMVSTYGDIARAVGIPGNARRVGWILNAVPEDLDLPCHRVVNRLGELSGGWAFGHPDVMRALLEEEDVVFVERHRVDLDRHRWDIPIAIEPPPTK